VFNSTKSEVLRFVQDHWAYKKKHEVFEMGEQLKKERLHSKGLDSTTNSCFTTHQITLIFDISRCIFINTII